MSKKIPFSTGRGWLLGLILVGGVASVGCLLYLGRGGAIHTEGLKVGIAALLDVYLPLVAIMAAFYFSEDHESTPERTVSQQSFIFAVVLTAIWVALPTVFLVITSTMEDALDLLASMAPFGDTGAAAAIVFYFARAT